MTKRELEKRGKQIVKALAPFSPHMRARIIEATLLLKGEPRNSCRIWARRFGPEWQGY